MKRIHVFYFGAVQGVGFRFTTQRIALDLNVTGWVKNLPDGRVELVAEADENVLKTLLDRVKNGFMKPYIHREEVIWESASGKFHSFEIKFH